MRWLQLAAFLTRSQLMLWLLIQQRGCKSFHPTARSIKTHPSISLPDAQGLTP